MGIPTEGGLGGEKALIKRVWVMPPILQKNCQGRQGGKEKLRVAGSGAALKHNQKPDQ